MMWTNLNLGTASSGNNPAADNPAVPHPAPFESIIHSINLLRWTDPSARLTVT